MCHLDQHNVGTFGLKALTKFQRSKALVINNTSTPTKSKRTRHDIQINKNNQSARMRVVATAAARKMNPQPLPKKVSPSSLPKIGTNCPSFSEQPLGSGSVLVPNREKPCLVNGEKWGPVYSEAKGYAITIHLLRDPSSFSIQFSPAVLSSIVHSSRLALELHNEQPSPCHDIKEAKTRGSVEKTECKDKPRCM